MREIKFRAWSKEYNKMCYEDILVGDSKTINDFYTAEYCLDINYNSKTYEIMQYTGLKDCQGKEIYEGDIVKIHANDVMLAYGTQNFIGEVKFIDGSFIVDNGEESLYLFNEAAEVEIIGDIHENPELLKE